MSTETTTPDVRTERTIYRCKFCERARKATGEKRPIVARKVEDRYVVVPYSKDSCGNWLTTRRYLDHTPRPTCECGRPMYFVGKVKGTYREGIPCGAKCVSATGPNCECSCGGKNHGAGH